MRRSSRRFRYARTTPIAAALLAAVAVTIGACNQEDPAPDRVSAKRSCTAPDDGFEVELPIGWHTNDGAVTQRCRWFHPQPFELRASADAGHIAIHIRRSPFAFADMLRAETEGPGTGEVLRRDERLIDGRRAVRIEARAGQSAFYAPGTRLCTYVVDLGGHALVGSTSEAGAEDFQSRVAALDQMMSSLQVAAVAPSTKSLGERAGSGE